MSRSKLLPMVAVWAVGVVGCAHCDICDEFPAPCNGPGCYSSGPAAGPVMVPAGAPVPVSNAVTNAPGPVISNRNESGTAMPPPAVDVPPPANPATEPSPPPADANAPK